VTNRRRCTVYGVTSSGPTVTLRLLLKPARVSPRVPSAEYQVFVGRDCCGEDPFETMAAAGGLSKINTLTPTVLVGANVESPLQQDDILSNT